MKVVLEGVADPGMHLERSSSRSGRRTAGGVLRVRRIARASRQVTSQRPGRSCDNGLGKGVSRGRLTREKALLLWQEMQALPVRLVDVPVDEKLLELALQYNLAVYDASYLSLAQARKLPLATGDGKLQQAAESAGIQAIKPLSQPRLRPL